MNFFGLLTIVFITLKLLGVIAWSWLWVLSPFWGPIVIWLVVALALTALSSEEKDR
jgi:fatty acid desaturase